MRRFLAIVGIGLFCAGLLILSSSKAPTPGASGDPEKDYLVAALTLINENDTAMRDISRAISQDDMHDLKEALGLAKDVLALSYGKYLDVSVPSQYAALDRKLKDSLYLRKDGLNEMLLYWQDYRQLHIVQAVKTIHKSVVLDDASLKIINSGLDKLIQSARPEKTSPR